MFSVTCLAPVNIALIKYWGKRDEELILPINDSLSMTLSTDEMCTKTTIAAAESFRTNRMWLNGEEVQFEKNPRVMRCVKAVQNLALASCELRFPITWKLHIASRNNFPTAAGLASSAAGYACLVFALARIYGISSTEELTEIARQGSGSACRSLYGGFVRWHMGIKQDGKDSIALQVAPAKHWPNMHVLILIVNDARKKTGSTKGMQRSVETSTLIQRRAEQIVPQRIEALTEAINQRDFEKFAEITMRDSNQFHAIALDTYPPCVYMNDVSHAIVNFVHAYNATKSSVHIAYTFDAGPNACLYMLEEHVPEVLTALQLAFPTDAAKNVEYLQGIPVPSNLLDAPVIVGDAPSRHLNGNNLSGSSVNIEVNARNLLKYIIHTKIGEGPEHLLADKEEENSLLASDGLPLPN